MRGSQGAGSPPLPGRAWMFPAGAGLELDHGSAALGSGMQAAAGGSLGAPAEVG